jgi:hypothetical protein
MKQNYVSVEISLTMSLVVTKVAMELRIFATYETHMIKQSLFPRISFTTSFTSVSPSWLYSWHQYPIHFRLFYSRTVVIWTNTQIPRTSSSKTEDTFQRRNISVCTQKLGKSVLIKKFWEELGILTHVLYVYMRTNLKINELV